MYQSLSKIELATVSLGQVQGRSSMWVVNVVLILAVIAFVSWFLWNFGGDLTNVFGVLFSGGQSLLFATGVILFEALKAAILAAVVGGALGLIFFVAGAPESTTKIAAISLGCLTFALFMLKALWENVNNLRWSIRHEIRNRYRKR